VFQYFLPEALFLRPPGIQAAISPFTRFLLIQGGTLVAAWTVLLVWASRKPVERRAVLLLVVPIAAGIGGSLVYLFRCGVLPGNLMFILAGPAAAGLFFAAYQTARRMNSAAAAGSWGRRISDRMLFKIPGALADGKSGGYSRMGRWRKFYCFTTFVSDCSGGFFPVNNPPAIRAIPPKIRIAAETKVSGREFWPTIAIMMVAANAPNPTNDQPTVRTIKFLAR
jgi:hypothetical protein